MIKNIIRRGMWSLGFDIVRYHPQPLQQFPADFSAEDIEIIRTARPYTMTSPERVFALIQSLKYIVKNNIHGDIVECGVWAGGSMMAAALTLIKLNSTERKIYLFDTFSGMTKPSEKDLSIFGMSGSKKFDNKKITEITSFWCPSSFEEVKKNIYRTGYDIRKIHFVKGRVEDTLPEAGPQDIALLRLDTDFYESTKYELIHLFPRLVTGGVLIIDDYGHWKGAREAADEYIAENHLRLLLNRIDYTGRIAVKQ